MRLRSRSYAWDGPSFQTGMEESIRAVLTRQSVVICVFEEGIWEGSSGFSLIDAASHPDAGGTQTHIDFFSPMEVSAVCPLCGVRSHESSAMWWLFPHRSMHGSGCLCQ